jgi:hypothetical protein
MRWRGDDRPPAATKALSIVLIVHLVATVFMAGVIWYVQLVHYPLMAGWPHDDFPRWEAVHREQTGLVVVPAMLLEGVTLGVLLVRRPSAVPAWLLWAGAAMLAAIWASTFAIQVPLHERLASGWDAESHAQLVQTNWLRTVLWSARVAVACSLLWQAGNRFERAVG